MKYFLDLDFNGEVDAFNASLSLINKTRKRHTSNNCMTKIFSFGEYNIYLQGSYFFKRVEDDKKLTLQEILEFQTIKDIQSIINNQSCYYNLLQVAKLYIKNNDMTFISEVEYLEKNPLETLVKSIPHLREAFLIESKMDIF